MSRPISRRRLLIGAVGGAAALAAAGCGSEPASTTMSVPRRHAVRVRNCGRAVQLDNPAERVVSTLGYLTETIVALGAGDRIIGDANGRAYTPMAQYAAGYAKVRHLAAEDPSLETFLAARPDLLVVDGPWRFDGKHYPTTAELRDAGIGAYVTQVACERIQPVATVDDVFTDIEQLARLLGAEARARPLLAHHHQAIEALEHQTDGRERVNVALVERYQRAFYAYGNGLYADIIQRAGGRNVLADAVPKGKTFAQVSTEALLARAPEVLLVVTVDRIDDAANFTAFRSALGPTPAVRTGRVHGFPAGTFGGSIRTLADLPEIARVIAA